MHYKLRWTYPLQLISSNPCLRTAPSPVVNMGRSSVYRSPSSKLRSQKRLNNFLSAKLSKLSTLPKTRVALSFSNSSLEISPTTPNLVKTDAEFTNYPEPCKTCFLPQCHFDAKHKWDFAVANKMFELMAKYCDPPDK